MSAVVAGTTTTLASYVQSMRTLRQDLKWAVDDLAFANTGGKIIYVFDTNVVALYLSPHNMIHAVRVLPEQNEEHGIVLLELATIVAEIMFSRGLPGQNGERPFISADHAVEVVSMSNAIYSKLRHDVQIGELREDYIRSRFGPALSAVNKINTDKSPDFLRQARKDFRPFLRTVADLSLKEGARLAKIYMADLLSNLDSAPGFDLLVVAPDPELLADWSETIFLTKQERKQQGVAYNDPDADPLANDKIDRDATTIAQVELLNGKADPETTRYVFVTCDDGLLQAYAKRHAITGGFFALRHPRQYLPLVDDPDTDDATDKKSLADVIDSLLVGLGIPLDTREQRAITAQVGQPRNIRKLTQEWFALCDSAVRSSIDKLAQHLATEINLLIPAFKAVDIDSALAEMIRAILSDVDRLHLAIGAVGSLLRYVHEAQNKKKRAARAPIAIKCASLENFVGAPEINKYLSQLVSPGNEAMVSTLQKRLSEQLPDGEAYLPPFFAACAWLRFMAWDAAFVFARGAINQIKRLQRGRATAPDLDDALHELYYISAVADRFRAVGPDEFDQASAKLDDCREYHSRKRQMLQQARALSEKAALTLMRLIASQFLRTRFEQLNLGKEIENLKAAQDLLRAAQKILDDQTKRAETSFYKAIHQQITVNFAQAAIYNFVFSISSQLPGTHNAELERIASELAEIRTGLRAEGVEHPVVEINYHMLSWIVSRGSAEHAARAEAAHAILDDYLLNGDNLHELDQKELQAYKKALGD